MSILKTKSPFTGAVNIPVVGSYEDPTLVTIFSNRRVCPGIKFVRSVCCKTALKATHWPAKSPEILKSDTSFFPLKYSLV